MSFVERGCLQAALLMAALISSSATAEIPSNSAEWPSGEGKGTRPRSLTGAGDWEIPDSALSLDAGTPRITINIPSEIKIDIDLTIHQDDSPSEERSERVRRVTTAGRRVHHSRCRSEINQAKRHP
jgi:hypothetical protein